MAITDNAYAYAQIIKQERLDDGTLMVYGKATDDSLDIDQQICDAGWLAKAMPEWFKSGGNIREQHSNIAAGVAKELDAKDDGFYINVHVVDPVSVKKTEAGVFKGFSVGIRSPRIVRDNKAVNGRIIDGQIVEVSLVDRPANPNAKLIMAKSVGTEIVKVEEFIGKSDEEVVETPVVETPVAEETPAPVAEETVVDAPADTVEETEEEKKKREEAEAANAEVTTETVAEETPVADAEPVVEETVDADAEKVTAIFDKVKTINTDLVKFDKDIYETARAALAQLIAVEAREMEAGSDERYSLSMLINAVHNLMCWYEGEQAEGEVMELVDTAMEMSAVPTDKSALSDDVVNDIIAKAVKSASDTVSAEINVYKETINALEDKLATALTKAVAGGPKRTGTKPSSNDEVSTFVLKAIEYRNKAATTTDRTLARGFRELAEDFDAKAKALTTN
jgi:hypothetical protein